MKLKKKALLYDIANIAYVIADQGMDSCHSLHRVRDICQEGNIDRVARILGLAYSQILAVLFPLLQVPDINVNRDLSSHPHDYEFIFNDSPEMRFSLTAEKKLKIKETAHEYMVCMVLADWLGITLPEAADVWKFKAQNALEQMQETVASISISSGCCFSRKVWPI